MVIGKGSCSTVLNEDQVYELLQEAFTKHNVSGEKVLAILPDHTRTAPMDVLFRVVYRLLAHKVKLLDFIIALGTRP